MRIQLTDIVPPFLLLSLHIFDLKNIIHAHGKSCQQDKVSFLPSCSVFMAPVLRFLCVYVWRL